MVVPTEYIYLCKKGCDNRKEQWNEDGKLGMWHVAKKYYTSEITGHDLEKCDDRQQGRQLETDWKK